MSGEAFLVLSLSLLYFAPPVFRAAIELSELLKEARSYAVNIKIYALPVFRPLKQFTN